jgi:hypothetical protein
MDHDSLADYRVQDSLRGVPLTTPSDETTQSIHYLITGDYTYSCISISFDQLRPIISIIAD